ncbi:MAG: hypothetical protein HRU03_01085 [Nanoarchaeales archaeon]|nr:hypothetical protein [Nanoarchaeales archaeon]
MENDVRDKIVLDLKKKFCPIDLSDTNVIRALVKEIDIKLEKYKDEYTSTYIVHKADVIFKRVLHNK